MSARLATVLGATTLIAFAVYRRFLRRPFLTWGATTEEAEGPLPGDELLDDADMVSTRAITIDAPPSAVFPWLVQMGVGRGGAYTYDWIENLLGLDMHSLDRIAPELQQLEVGEVLPMQGEGTGLRVEILAPDRVFALRSEDGRWVWTFVLGDRNGGTRLISRNRIKSHGSSLALRLGMIVMEPGSLVMERKMLLGIKERAEGLARPETQSAGARVGARRLRWPRSICTGCPLAPAAIRCG